MVEIGHSGGHRVTVPGGQEQPAVRGQANCCCGWQSPQGLEFSLVLRLSQVHLEECAKHLGAA